MRIQRLPQQIANQIAAGEVIERPASVVKELLENAIDANADDIHIEIDAGGLYRIKVSDNGSGILADDLTLAVTAHATSKLTCLQDLYAISSMGFRGEALASIGSVARLKITSKPVSQDHAMALSVIDGQFQLYPCARQQGTSVEVTDLFFNAPVRKKFLKAEHLEYQAIDALVRRFAMSVPEMAIRLSHNGKVMLALPAAACEASMQLRIKKLLGQAFVDQAIYLETTRDDLHLYGWISALSYQRSQNDKQWVYINRRMVKDKLLNHALKQAYEGGLYPDRHPACLLYLSLPSRLVDVNVHPTKHEVRFETPRMIHDLFVSELKQALSLNEGQVKTTSKSDRPVASRPSEMRSSLIQETSLYHAHESLVRLSSEFALVFVQHQPFLVDLEALQYHHQLDLLKQVSFPLASRSLLVPVSYSVEAGVQPIIEEKQADLDSFGIQYNFLSDTTIVFRSIPCVLPQLDFGQLLTRLSEKRQYTVEEWYAVLAECHQVDIAQLNEEEQAALLGFFETYLAVNTGGGSWYRPLSSELCRAWLCR